MEERDKWKRKKGEMGVEMDRERAEVDGKRNRKEKKKEQEE